MKDTFNDQHEDPENLDETEKLDQALHDVEMIYRSRCVDVPLTSNVKVVEIDKDTDEILLIIREQQQEKKLKEIAKKMVAENPNPNS